MARERRSTRLGRTPRPLNSFVGRARDLEEVVGLLSGHRLVSLIGTGGAGKTRLAAQVAMTAMSGIDERVRWVDLASTTDAALVPATVARALEVPEPAAGDVVAAVSDAIGSDPLLLVLDNCEHLIDASADLARALLDRCPPLTILATSREPLGVDGETVRRVPPLSVPPPGAADVGCFESVRLFLERASEAGAHVTADDDDAVAEICRRLDGLPLAIELAAARVSVLAPAQVLDGLNDRFAMLRARARSSLARHRSLQASVEWSYELLPAAQQELLCRLSVFAGSFSLDAAERVCWRDGDRMGLIDGLSSLVDRSLVQVDRASDQARYLLLETIREYGAAKLGDSDGTADLHDAHLAYFVHLAEQGERPLEGSADQLLWLDRLDRELPNLRAASDWAHTSGDVESEARLTGALWFFYVYRSYLTDLRTAVVTRQPSPDSPRLRARILLAAGWCHYLTGRPADAFAVSQEALAIGRAVSDPWIIGRALHNVGTEDFTSGRDPARERLEAAIAESRRADDPMYVALSSSVLGYLYLQAGDTAVARQRFDEALAVSRRVENRFTLGYAQAFLSELYALTGAFGDAEAAIRDGMAASQAIGDALFTGIQGAFLGHVQIRTGRLDEAEASLDAALRLARETQNAIPLSLSLGYRGLLELCRGDDSAARGTLTGAASTAERIGFRWHGAHWLVLLAAAELRCGKERDAELSIDRADAIARSSNNIFGIASAQLARGALAQARSAWADAASAAYDALAHAHRAAFVPTVVDALESLAATFAGMGRHEDALRLLAVAARERESRQYRQPAAHVGVIETCRAALGDDRFTQAWAEGADTSLDAMVAYVTRGRGSRGRAAFGWESLTPTELEVVRLVAEGLTNPQIAEKLFLSPRTVQSHLRRIFARLGVRTRGELAADAARRRV